MSDAPNEGREEKDSSRKLPNWTRYDMTPTQTELLNSIDFWRQRHDDQLEYMKSVLNRVKAKQENALRKVEIHKSAREVLSNIEKQIRNLKT